MIAAAIPQLLLATSKTFLAAQPMWSTSDHSRLRPIPLTQYN